MARVDRGCIEQKGWAESAGREPGGKNRKKALTGGAALSILHRRLGMMSKAAEAAAGGADREVEGVQAPRTKVEEDEFFS